MKKLSVIAITIVLLVIAFSPQSAKADPGTLYVDAANICNGNFPCNTTIQAAINAASDGDTILVYPGTYDPQINIAVPCWGGTYPAQGIVVWKANLTIQAVDPDPANTVIQNTLGAWMDWWRIQRITGGQWTGCGTAQTGGFNPGTSASPNALMIVKPGVTIEGFTFHAHVFAPSGGYNAAGVMIGGVAPGDPNSLGADNNVVQNNVFSDLWHAVYIWHSSGNQILNNTVSALGNTGHWAGISSYDGYTNAQIGLGHLSENNFIAHNTLADKGIALGAWAPSIWTSNAGSQVCSNTTTQVGVSYAHGPVIIGCNSPGFWQYNTDNVLRIVGVSYTGDTFLTGNNVLVNLSAILSYDGSADGSGVGVIFTINGTEYPATTVAGGEASTTATLPHGSYTVQTQVAVCDDCEYTDTDALVINAPPVANPGGPYLGAVNTPIMFDGSLSYDPDGNPLTYAWTFGDGNTGSGVAPTNSYAGADIYDVCLTVNDGYVDSELACTIAVIYDPAAGFVTGGGWIISPAGAYKADPTLTGKATFGFVAKYKKGANVPDGNTEFQFKAGNLNFKSTSYEWLVVAGMKAQFKGVGTINGQGSYKFMIWADDDNPDTFRIHIWDDNGTVYDNGSQQALGGGSIVIHK